MSGNLRLNGATSGYSELAAPDAAGDQTFTFPAKGGTLAIATSNSGGQPVPGYQEGKWTPTLNGGFNNIENPVYKNSYFRVGNMVTVSGRVMFSSSQAGGNSADNIIIENLPYGNIADNANEIGAYVGSLFCRNLTSDVATRPFVPFFSTHGGGAIFIYYGGSTGSYVQCPYSKFTTQGGIIFTLTYKTNNTDWKPSNGAKVDS